ncbi:hypothetical protein TNCV_4882431 [Trichonephila clavipes]|nr:hypothetical protein TNCV_4882431 [Trichonephila clavipes]
MRHKEEIPEGGTEHSEEVWTQHEYSACVEAGIEKKNFDFDQSLEREQKPSVEETRLHFSETSFRLCRGWNPSTKIPPV